jgi:hypothetical protein
MPVSKHLACLSQNVSGFPMSGIPRLVIRYYGGFFNSKKNFNEHIAYANGAK